MDPANVYGILGASFTALLRELGWLPAAAPHHAAAGLYVDEAFSKRIN